MSQPGQIDFTTIPLKQFVLTLRIIVFGLAMGLLTFACVAHFVLEPAGAPEGEDLFMTASGLAIGAAMLVAHPVVVGVMRRQAAANLPDDEAEARGRLLGVYHTSVIVACAMLQVGGFLNLIVYGFLDGHRASLAMAGLLLAVILTKFPSEGGVTDWYERRLRDARDRAALG